MAQQRRQAISLQRRLAPSSDEEETGLKIASKLESVMREKPRSSWSLMSTTHRLYHKPSKPRYHNMDCQLVLDSSGSITSSQFELAKRATKVIIQNRTEQVSAMFCSVLYWIVVEVYLKSHLTLHPCINEISPY